MIIVLTLFICSINLWANDAFKHIENHIISFNSCSSCKQVCSGVKLKKNIILTAAHCFNERPDTKSIRLYRYGRYVRKELKVVPIIHPLYARSTALYDVAIVILKNHKAKDNLEIGFNDDAILNGDLIISGVYQGLKKRVASHKVVEVEDHVIFAQDTKKAQICQGNSGGGIYSIKNDQVFLSGIVSGVNAYPSQLKGKTCSSGFDSRHTNLKAIQGWIIDHIGSLELEL